MPKLNATTVVRKGYEVVVLLAGEEVPDWAADLVGGHLIADEPESADESDSEPESDEGADESDEGEDGEPDTAPTKTARK